MDLPDPPEYDCPECGISEWRWMQIADLSFWKCIGCREVYHGGWRLD